MIDPHWMILSESRPPKIFISYSHDSQHHEDRVLAFADQLRQDGIDAMVDQYVTAPMHGWPIWMDQEIKKADFVLIICTEVYLRRVELREEPGKGRGVLWEGKLIYNYLYSNDWPVQKFIPVLFENGNPLCIPGPLQGLTYYSVSTAEGYERLCRHLLGQPKHRMPPIGNLKTLAPNEPESYPASLEARFEGNMTALDRRNRLAMIKRVRNDWIGGVLNQSLYKVERIDLGLEARADEVEGPLNRLIQVADAIPTPIAAGTPLTKIFEDHGESLLILGAPGTGKTTLLLELAQALLDRAERDDSRPIPVVFNLNSWSLRHQALTEWLISELNERNEVPKSLARRWIESEQVLPLLDGLDEVSSDHRLKCLEAINLFRRGHGLLPIVVCSRIADYEVLGKKLRLRHAVLVQPLSGDQIQEYLVRGGEPLLPLLMAVRADASLAEVVATPLMLCVAILAYREAPVEFMAEDSIERRRLVIITKFVDAMLKRRSMELRYTKEQVIHWLSWLACALSRNKQTVFYLENLNPKWLTARGQRLSKSTSLISEMLVGLFGGFYLWRAMVGSPIKLRPIEIEWLRFSHLRSAFIAGVTFIVGGWLFIFEQVGDAVLFGLVGGLVVGFNELVKAGPLEFSREPNQGTRDSVKAALVALFGIGLTAGLTFFKPRSGKGRNR